MSGALAQASGRGAWRAWLALVGALGVAAAIATAVRDPDNAAVRAAIALVVALLGLGLGRAALLVWRSRWNQPGRGIAAVLLAYHAAWAPLALGHAALSRVSSNDDLHVRLFPHVTRLFDRFE